MGGVLAWRQHKLGIIASRHHQVITSRKAHPPAENLYLPEKDLLELSRLCVSTVNRNKAPALAH